MPELTHRLATIEDLDRLRALMARAIEHLQAGFLSPEQVRASHAVMGLDTQLVKDQTYFLIEADGALAGCGGWSWRATLYGGDASLVARQPARIRAMYTDPAFARRGVGRRIMDLCEAAARAAGFRRVEMMATLAGEPLYRACGYVPIERIESAPINGVSVPLIRMGKALDRSKMTSHQPVRVE
jgi:GNAT superfamily N-acetyltransferase